MFLPEVAEVIAHYRNELNVYLGTITDSRALVSTRQLEKSLFF